MIGTEDAGPQPAADLEAVHLRQHHVEHDQVEGLLGEARERLAAVGCLHHFVAVALQRERQQRLDRLLVVDQEDARGTVRHTRSVDTVHKRARRSRLPSGVPARAARAVRGRVLAPEPPRRRCARARSRTPSTRPARTAASAARLAAAARRGVPAAPARGRPGDAALADRVGQRLPRRGLLRLADTAPAGARSTARPARDGRRRAPRALEPPHRRARPPRLARLARSRRPLRHRGAARAGAHLPHAGASAEQDSSEPGKPQLIGRDLRKTLVLVSTSGGSGGAAGRARVGAGQDAAPIDGVLALGDLASVTGTSPGSCRGRTGSEQPPLGWQRTVEVAVRQEVGADPGQRAGQLSVVAPGAAARGHRAGRARARRAAGRAAAGQRRARAGRRARASRASA